jgi:3-dehydroquinate dehydratase II
MAKVLIINGPNINMLGKRETDVYGTLTLAEIEAVCREEYKDIDLTFFQSNIEGELINAIQKAEADAIVLNAGGYTHTSVALRDALTDTDIPVIEVHISNIAGRESFRHESLLSPACAGVIFGFGTDGYALAISACLRMLRYDL